MVVLQRSFYIPIIILACVALSSVKGLNKLQKIARMHEKSRLLKPVIKKHLEEVDEASPLHIIIDLKVNGIILNSLLIEYMQSRSSYLWNSEKLIPKNVESCAVINKVVGIYSDFTHIRPLDQRKFFDKLWRPRARFAIWITGLSDEVIIQTLLEHFWSLDCLNVAVFTSAKSFKVVRFTYNPFIFGPHGRGQLMRARKYHRLFPDKLKNLHGYEIPISVYHVVPNAILAHYTTLKGARGSAVELINYFASLMNFTIVLKSSPLPLSTI
ncbi:hypothetical protein PV326_012685 [Microctonus aethiopoides]|nr:hypothetical protein PV326_012685 [Microctonus aethiopoides]